MGTMLIFSIRTLIKKANVYYKPWQNYSFCRDEQAQRSSTTRPSKDNLAYVLISATKARVTKMVGPATSQVLEQLS